MNNYSFRFIFSLQAKLDGYPYWPAKLMRVSNHSENLVEVLFFGDFSTAELPANSCFLLSKMDPNSWSMDEITGPFENALSVSIFELC